MYFESGDQNGYIAPSVPATGCAMAPSMGLTHSVDGPSPSLATNASRLPSGESANGVASTVEIWTRGGRVIEVR